MQISEKLIQMSARGDIAPMSSKDALAIEAALSAAEPVATVAEMGAGGMRVLMPHPPGSADHLPIGTKLYAAPPAPSVAVKDWSAEIKKLREYRRLAYNTGFLYLADWMEEMAAALSAQVQDVAVSPAIKAIAAERARQIEKEGWPPEHDDKYTNGELLEAAACYALHNGGDVDDAPGAWPWSRDFWKPTTRQRDLEKAGALIAAELDRVIRAAAPAKQED